MELKGKKINFLGDSITQGSGVADQGNLFWKVVAARTGAVCRGYGIGGTRIAKNIRPSSEPAFDAYFASRVDSMDPDADVIVVFGGTNDFGHGDAPLGAMPDRDENTFYGALHLLFTKLYTRYPQAKLVVMTPTHRISEDVAVNEIGIRNQTNLAGYAAIIREVAEYYSVPVLDLFAGIGLQPKIPELKRLYMPDGLHPNDAGHAIIADRLITFIREL